MRTWENYTILVVAVAFITSWGNPNQNLGIFEGNNDIGKVKYKGSFFIKLEYLP